MRGVDDTTELKIEEGSHSVANTDELVGKGFVGNCAELDGGADLVGTAALTDLVLEAVFS